jgi:hypothetical protein
MSSPPECLYPVALLQDRYSGTYSEGAWLAVANADRPAGYQGACRMTWIMGDEGPSGCDVTASTFWRKPPGWIGVGASPDAAIAALAENHAADLRKLPLRGI